MPVDPALAAALRATTGAGTPDCCDALFACDGDLDRAAAWLRERRRAPRLATSSARASGPGVTTNDPGRWWREPPPSPLETAAGRTSLEERARLGAIGASGALVVCDPRGLRQAVPLAGVELGRAEVHVACVATDRGVRTASLAIIRARTDLRELVWRHASDAEGPVTVLVGCATLAVTTTATAARLTDADVRRITSDLAFVRRWRGRAGTVLGSDTGLGDGRYPVCFGEHGGEVRAVTVDFL